MLRTCGQFHQWWFKLQLLQHISHLQHQDVCKAREALFCLLCGPSHEEMKPWVWGWGNRECLYTFVSVWYEQHECLPPNLIWHHQISVVIYCLFGSLSIRCQKDGVCLPSYNRCITHTTVPGLLFWIIYIYLAIWVLKVDENCSTHTHIVFTICLTLTHCVLQVSV